MIAALAEVGVGVSVPHLQQHFGDVARAELADLRTRYRRLYRGRQAQRVLHWQRPGSVWAIDYSAAPCVIEGCYEDLLAVRDLASGYALWWQAVEEATALTTLAALHALFTAWGRPLVLKADNGGPFRAEVVAELLEEQEVTVLYSPPYTPRYNGAIEAGIGALKMRVHEEATRQGRPGAWTCADIEAAREEANRFSYPRGAGGADADGGLAGASADQRRGKEGIHRGGENRASEAGARRVRCQGGRRATTHGLGEEATRGHQRGAGGAGLSLLHPEANSSTDCTRQSDMRIA